jgi:hypothetical protein
LQENFDRFNSQIYKEKEMADFRRCILAFAVVALLMGLVPTASAQVVNGVQCIANSAVPPTLRSEGLTELVGDIVLNCSGGTPTPAGLQIPQANITIFLNTQVTSRLYSGTTSEAVLTVDEPTPSQTSVGQTCVTAGGCAAFAAGAGSPLAFPANAPNSTEFKTSFNIIQGTANSLNCTVGVGGCVSWTNPNVFQGSVSGNSVTFIGIPIDPPGTQGTRIYRITNVRANATIPAPGGSGTPGQIIALISATPATSPGGFTSTFAINNPTQIVGFVQTSLSTSITAQSTSLTGLGSTLTAPTIQQCIGAGVAGSKTGSAAIGQLNFIELFPTAFKNRTVSLSGGPGANGGGGVTTQDTLGNIYNSESGYVNPRLASPLGNAGGVTTGEAGLADSGTRLRATFNNIPNGVTLFVSVQNTQFQSATTSTLTGTFAQLTTAEIGQFSPIGATTAGGSDVGAGSGKVSAPAGGVFQVPIVSGSGVAVWEVLAANSLTNQTYSFAFFAVATPAPATNSPAVGTGTVNLSYSPAPNVFGASAGAVASSSLHIPRFIDTSTAANVLGVTICRTNLLFPYVTNSGGFDTGIAISNTSADPFGTPTQQGPCTLNFFGTNAPAAVTSASIPAGANSPQGVFLASTVAPNFTGYVIAVCNFQYAHGFAFVSDVGARNLAMGYLALIIPAKGLVQVKLANPK